MSGSSSSPVGRFDSAFINDLFRCILHQILWFGSLQGQGFFPLRPIQQAWSQLGHQSLLDWQLGKESSSAMVDKCGCWSLSVVWSYKEPQQSAGLLVLEISSMVALPCHQSSCSFSSISQSLDWHVWNEVELGVRATLVRAEHDSVGVLSNTDLRSRPCL